MNVLAISDSVDPVLYEHFDLARWRDVDLVVSCGDLPPNYLDFLGTSLGCPVLYVRGNHDDYEPDAYAGYFNLHGRSWTGSGITVVGFEGCRAYNGGPHQYSERDMSRRVRKSTHGLSKVDLVVTHAPPLGCNDLNDTCHQGFACFRDLVQRCHPQYFVHGHTHLYSGSRRLSVLDGTTTVNAHGHYLLTL